ncbi:hypothetical protein [Segetibacter aerophilus]|uniref:Uncharacterized protein n=1 Tax=Segetibacter aerophilus TaxID=670293 RepID=A0A512BGW8_9BACT|nr:hypothetical protein [Segetibacter aerophilus]GEO11125.1 hypothetical protein SAE01_36210 [Segetibacter aerophilus]
MKRKTSGTDTSKPISFRQLRRKLEQQENYELNGIIFSLQRSKGGKDAIRFKAVGTSDLGVFACDQWLIKGVLRKENIKGKEHNVHHYTAEDLFEMSEGRQVFHSGLAFTENYIIDDESEKVTLESPMSLLEILSYGIDDFDDALVDDEFIRKSQLDEIKKVNYCNKHGLKFSFQAVPLASIRVAASDLNMGSVISIGMYLKLVKRGIDTMGEGIFIDLLSKGEAIYINDVFFIPAISDLHNDEENILDKELVIQVGDEHGLIVEKKLGIDIVSTTDLLKAALNMKNFAETPILN